MFIENKYTVWYTKLVERRKEFPLSKDIQYCESHHIVPKSLGGSDESENLVLFTAREHFIAHLLLTRMVNGDNRRKMYWALHRISFTGSRKYEWFRESWSKHMTDNHPAHHEDTGQAWRDTVSAKVKETWDDPKSNDRRLTLSKASGPRFSNWKKANPDEFIKNQKNAAAASKAKNSLRIEYNGVQYIGWKELLEGTGVTKSLYKKYYLNGIDPTFRIGKDGPMTKDEKQQLLKMKGESVCA